MRIFAALCFICFAFPAICHEFWIEPQAYQVAPDEKMQAVLLNGQEFEGSELGFLPLRFTRFTMASGMRQANVENRIGARPALDTPPLAEGLHAIGYQSRMSTLGYSEWEKFMKFADHKDFQDIQARHDARGLPRTGFNEGYWRLAKSLIGVGHAQGTDFRQRLAVEFVALDNPYTDDVSAGLRVQLFYLDDIVADGQVELFEKAPDGTVNITLHRTGADGISTLPVKPGHSYLIDHVVLREPTAELAAQADIVWETLWASLTLAIPE